MLWADNDKPIHVGQLPTKAQTLITTYFKNHKIALAKMESGLLSKSYDVILLMEKNWSLTSQVIGPKLNVRNQKFLLPLFQNLSGLS